MVKMESRDLHFKGLDDDRGQAVAGIGAQTVQGGAKSPLSPTKTLSPGLHLKRSLAEESITKGLVPKEHLTMPSFEFLAETAVSDSALANQPESKSFMATALAWQGSVTPRVLPRVVITAIYATIVSFALQFFPRFAMPMTPFEYSGAVLALILVLRVNAGHDRWWEARKIWGAIVNQSRNLALVVYGYSEKKDDPVVISALRWIAAWPHVMRESLRKESSFTEVEMLVGKQGAEKLRRAEHTSMFVGLQIAGLLAKLRQSGLDSLAFLRAETERSQLIDAIGACERIRNTRMPLVLAIKTRRFILLFLLLLPFALVDRAGWFTPLVVALASYPLLSLDEIGAELQNPFSSRNLSHLPLGTICRNISRNVLGLLHI
jgi:putative membrane protein